MAASVQHEVDGRHHRFSGRRPARVRCIRTFGFANGPRTNGSVLSWLDVQERIKEDGSHGDCDVARGTGDKLNVRFPQIE